jgi:hypothetical protein
LDALIAEANQPDETGASRAIAARYDAASRRVFVDLDSGAAFMFPVDRVEGLAGQSDEHLGEVTVMPGDGLGWPALDRHFDLASLVLGTFGGKAWMRRLRSELLRQAAKSTSPERARAARENGKKGGRP